MELNAPILVVDDEETNCLLVKANLELSGYTVETSASAEEAMRLPLEKYSLILLDVMMGHMSGFEFAKYLRARSETKSIPIIFITAKDEENAVIEGFGYGADDYITKPFSMKEMVLRVKSVLNRCYMPIGEHCYKTLKINTIKRRCYVANEEVILTKTEFDLLFMLMKNTGSFFSRDAILNSVWESGTVVLDRTVDVNINRLRGKLGIYGKNIVTKSGYGYGFVE